MAVRLIFGRGYFRTAPRVPQDVQGALRATVRAMEESESESFPGPDDVHHIVAPSLPCWRRRVASSAWWVFYELRDDGTVVLTGVFIPA